MPPAPPGPAPPLRRATPEDAQAVGDLWLAAASRAWSSFLSADTLAEEGTVQRWRQRIATIRDPEVLLLTHDDLGLAGFVWAAPSRGAVEALYTHPRRWGTGVGRRLLTAAEAHLGACAVTSATLWTEERNHRARAVYERAGWHRDGGVRRRVYAGTALRELRHRKQLTPAQPDPRA